MAVPYRLASISARLAPLLLLALAAAGCGPVVAPKPPPTEALSLSKNLEWGIPSWADELSLRFDHPILVSCHGGTNQWTGRWCLFPDKGPPLDAETVGAVLHQLWPGRDIVLLSCNRDGKSIAIPRVFYARKLVAASPLIPVPGDTNDAWGFQEGHP